VIEVLSQFSKCVERASVDEAYVDLTDEVEKRLKENPAVLAEQLPNTHISGWEEEEDGAAEGQSL
jgi:DNA polymerase eta